MISVDNCNFLVMFEFVECFLLMILFLFECRTSGRIGMIKSSSLKNLYSRCIASVKGCFSTKGGKRTRRLHVYAALRKAATCGGCGKRIPMLLLPSHAVLSWPAVSLS